MAAAVGGCASSDKLPLGPTIQQGSGSGGGRTSALLQSELASPMWTTMLVLVGPPTVPRDVTSDQSITDLPLRLGQNPTATPRRRDLWLGVGADLRHDIPLLSIIGLSHFQEPAWISLSGIRYLRVTRSVDGVYL